ncbi:MAG: hypothetical protein ACYCT1_02200 [Steroidobacteraceae bacterium]
MAKKSEDEKLIDEVKERAAFMAGCEPGDHCAVLDLGIEDTREAACRRLAAASACLNARNAERPGLQVIRALSSGVYAGIAFGPYDTAQEAESAATRAGSALLAHDEKERRARHARQEAEVRQEIEAAAAAETESAEMRAIEQETEQAATDVLGR